VIPRLVAAVPDLLGLWRKLATTDSPTRVWPVRVGTLPASVMALEGLVSESSLAPSSLLVSLASRSSRLLHVDRFKRQQQQTE
jgi:hypothetical protein